MSKNTNSLEQSGGTITIKEKRAGRASAHKATSRNESYEMAGGGKERKKMSGARWKWD